MASRLNSKTIEQIKADPVLWVKMCAALNIKASSMNTVLTRNTTLTEISILQLLSKYLKKPINALIEEAEPATV
jgi:hypothetical protein